MSAGDPGRGHKRVKTVIFALLWCFGRGTEGELWQNLREQFRGGGIRKGTGLELAVKEGAMRAICTGRYFGGGRAECVVTVFDHSGCIWVSSVSSSCP